MCEKLFNGCVIPYGKNHTIENGGEFHPNMCNMTQKKIESIFKESIIEIGCDHAIQHKK